MWLSKNRIPVVLKNFVSFQILNGLGRCLRPPNRTVQNEVITAS